jgi:hypothetical protein
MNKTLIRIVACLLVTCLIADPALASQPGLVIYTPISSIKYAINGSFSVQALVPVHGYFERARATRRFASQMDRWTASLVPAARVGLFSIFSSLLPAIASAATRHGHHVKHVASAVKAVDSTVVTQSAQTVKAIAQRYIDIRPGEGLARAAHRAGLKDWHGVYEANKNILTRFYHGSPLTHPGMHLALPSDASPLPVSPLVPSSVVHALPQPPDIFTTVIPTHAVSAPHLWVIAVVSILIIAGVLHYLQFRRLQKQQASAAETLRPAMATENLPPPELTSPLAEDKIEPVTPILHPPVVEEVHSVLPPPTPVYAKNADSAPAAIEPHAPLAPEAQPAVKTTGEADLNAWALIKLVKNLIADVENKTISQEAAVVRLNILQGQAASFENGVLNSFIRKAEILILGKPSVSTTPKVQPAQNTPAAAQSAKQPADARNTGRKFISILDNATRGIKNLFPSREQIPAAPVTLPTPKKVVGDDDLPSEETVKNSGLAQDLSASSQVESKPEPTSSRNRSAEFPSIALFKSKGEAMYRKASAVRPISRSSYQALHNDLRLLLREFSKSLSVDEIAEAEKFIAEKINQLTKISGKPPENGSNSSGNGLKTDAASTSMNTKPASSAKRDSMVDLLRDLLADTKPRTMNGYFSYWKRFDALLGGKPPIGLLGEASSINGALAAYRTTLMDGSKIPGQRLPDLIKIYSLLDEMRVEVYSPEKENHWESERIALLNAAKSQHILKSQEYGELISGPKPTFKLSALGHAYNDIRKALALTPSIAQLDVRSQATAPSRMDVYAWGEELKRLENDVENFNPLWTELRLHYMEHLSAIKSRIREAKRGLGLEVEPVQEAPNTAVPAAESTLGTSGIAAFALMTKAKMGITVSLFGGMQALILPYLSHRASRRDASLKDTLMALGVVLSPGLLFIPGIPGNFEIGPRSAVLLASYLTLTYLGIYLAGRSWKRSEFNVDTAAAPRNRRIAVPLSAFMAVIAVMFWGLAPHRTVEVAKPVQTLQRTLQKPVQAAARPAPLSQPIEIPMPAPTVEAPQPPSNKPEPPAAKPAEAVVITPPSVVAKPKPVETSAPETAPAISHPSTILGASVEPVGGSIALGKSGEIDLEITQADFIGIYVIDGPKGRLPSFMYKLTPKTTPTGYLGAAPGRTPREFRIKLDDLKKLGAEKATLQMSGQSGFKIRIQLYRKTAVSSDASEHASGARGIHAAWMGVAAPVVHHAEKTANQVRAAAHAAAPQTHHFVLNMHTVELGVAVMGLIGFLLYVNRSRIQRLFQNWSEDRALHMNVDYSSGPGSESNVGPLMVFLAIGFGIWASLSTWIFNSGYTPWHAALISAACVAGLSSIVVLLLNRAKIASRFSALKQWLPPQTIKAPPETDAKVQALLTDIDTMHFPTSKTVEDMSNRVEALLNARAHDKKYKLSEEALIAMRQTLYRALQALKDRIPTRNSIGPTHHHAIHIVPLFLAASTAILQLIHMGSFRIDSRHLPAKNPALHAA